MGTAESLAIVDGKYQLVRRLGEGGMGSVYEGKHLGTGRRVAVKVVSPDALAKGNDVADRFRREAMASGAIDSKYIAHVLDTGLDPKSKSPYIVMELLVGEDVQQALARLRKLTVDLALKVAAQACMGLAIAHDAGVIHRDVKPANLFLARRDGEIVVKLLDFGVAKVRADPVVDGAGDHTRSGVMLGSPLYMSPEQARGRKTIDHRSDLFSLGVVLYEMLTGKTPHAGADSMGDLIVKICGERARPIGEVAPWIPAPAQAIVHKAIAIEPGERFATAGEMLEALRALLPRGLALDDAAALNVELPPMRPRAASAPSIEPPIAAASSKSDVKSEPKPASAGRSNIESAATVALGPTTKRGDTGARKKEISTGSGARAPEPSAPKPEPPVPKPEPSAPALKTSPKAISTGGKEPMQRRIFIPAARKAAVQLWGEEGLNQIAATLADDTREEFFRATSGEEWMLTRHVIEWCLRTFEGPCGRDRNKMAEYVDRLFDMSYGVVRRLVLKMADPLSLIPRIPGFWKQDHTHGEMTAVADPAGNACILNLKDSPYVDLVHSRAGLAETYRYAFSMTRAKNVTESHALERPSGNAAKPILVIRLRWQ